MNYTHMDTMPRDRYAAALRALKEQVQGEIDLSTESDTVALDGSMGRISRIEALHRQQIAREQNERRRERLQRIDSALLRLTQGTYGQCGRCRRPITPERLDAFPDAVLCIQCANTPR